MLYVCVESTSECLLTRVVNYGNGCLRLCEMFTCARLVHNTLYVRLYGCLYGCREARITPPDVCMYCMAVWLVGRTNHTAIPIIPPSPCERVPVVYSGSEFTVPKRMSDEVIQNVALSNLGVVIVCEMIYRYMYIYVAGCSQILGSELQMVWLASLLPGNLHESQLLQV